MKLADHLVAWLVAIKSKRGLPIAMGDGTGRDAALPEKIAGRLVDLRLIEPDRARKNWIITAAGREIVGSRG